MLGTLVFLFALSLRAGAVAPDPNAYVPALNQGASVDALASTEIPLKSGQQAQFVSDDCWFYGTVVNDPFASSATWYAQITRTSCKVPGGYVERPLSATVDLPAGLRPGARARIKILP